jgi:hypothetical protein
MGRKSVIGMLGGCFVLCAVMIVTIGGCGSEDKSPPKEDKAASAKTVAKYATPTEVFNAMYAANIAGQFDTEVECYSPARLDNEADTIVNMMCWVISKDKVPADKVEQLEEFVKAQGFKGLSDLKAPKDVDPVTFAKGLHGRVKDKKALVAGWRKRQAADMKSKGRPAPIAPTLKDVKIEGDRAQGAVVGSNSEMAAYFEFIDGSWRSTLRPK